jgi:hypothetical protein
LIGSALIELTISSYDWYSIFTSDEVENMLDNRSRGSNKLLTIGQQRVSEKEKLLRETAGGVKYLSCSTSVSSIFHPVLSILDS